jgi:hypothetical protein
MKQRARFILHNGVEIYMLDCSNCKPAEVHEIIDQCALDVRSRPPKSVRTMTIAGGGKFDNETVNRLKELTKGNEPYVKKAALVGITGLYKVVVMAIAAFSRREFHMFDTVDEAKEYLAAD